MNQNLEQPTPTPTFQGPRKNSIRLIILLIILFLFGILAVGYLWWQKLDFGYLNSNLQNITVATSTDQFTDWKTYRDEEYGIEFKYPISMNVSNAWVYDRINLNTNIEDYNSPSIEIKITAENTPNTYKEALNRLKNLDSVKEREFTISGVKAFDIYKEVPESLDLNYPPNLLIGNEYHEIYFENRDIGTISIKSDLLDKVSLYKFLSSFKFIATSTPAIDTSQWKIYEDKKYGFKFKYPDIFKIANDRVDNKSTVRLTSPNYSGYEVYMGVFVTGINANTSDTLNELSKNFLQNIDGWNAIKNDFSGGKITKEVMFKDNGLCKYEKMTELKCDELEDIWDGIYKTFEFTK